MHCKELCLVLMLRIIKIFCQKYAHKSVRSLAYTHTSCHSVSVTAWIRIDEFTTHQLSYIAVNAGVWNISFLLRFFFFFLCSAAVCQLHHSEDPLIKSHTISRNNNFNNHPFFSSVAFNSVANMTDNKVGVWMSSGECGGSFILHWRRLGETERKTEGPELSSKLLSPLLQSVCNTLKAPSIIRRWHCSHNS